MECHVGLVYAKISLLADTRLVVVLLCVDWSVKTGFFKVMQTDVVSSVAAVSYLS